MDTYDIDFIDQAGQEWTKRERYTALREENVRLTLERDEARRIAREHHLHACESCAVTESDLIAAEAKLARLEGLILAARDSEDPYGLEAEALWNECDRIRAQREEPLK